MPAFGSTVRLGPGLSMQAGAQSAFVPTSLAGLVAWFDMQDGAAYTTASGSVDSVTNKASAVVWSQGTAASRPLFDATKLGGRPCMDYDGSNDIIISSEAGVVAAMTDSPALTVFGVVQSDNADLSVYWLSAGSTTLAGLAGSRGFGTNTTGTGNYLAGASNDAGTVKTLQSTISTGNTSPHAFEYFTDGVNGSIVIDGGTPDPNNSAQTIGTLTPTQCGIGGAARQTSNSFWNGCVGEVIVYSRLLSAADRSAIRVYLGAKWGITVTP